MYFLMLAQKTKAILIVVVLERERRIDSWKWKEERIYRGSDGGSRDTLNFKCLVLLIRSGNGTGTDLFHPQEFGYGLG